MYKQRIKKIILLFTNAPILVGALCGVLFVFIFTQTVFAGGWDRVEEGFKNTAGQFFPSFKDVKSGGQTDAPLIAYQTVVTVFVSIMGVIFLTNIVMAGFQWMNAGGEQESIKKAQAKIIHNVIGIAIIFGAYLITAFVIQPLIEATQK